MKRKTYLKIITIFVIALFFVGCNGGTKKDNETPEVKGEEKVVESSEKKVKTGKMTDDKYVEITAQTLYITSEYFAEAENKTIAEQVLLSEKMTIKMENAYKNFGVTDDEYSAYGDDLMEKNPEHYMKLYERIVNKVDELEKEGK